MVESGGGGLKKRCSDRWDEAISRVDHFLGVIEVNRFVCRVGYFDANVRESLVYK